MASRYDRITFTGDGLYRVPGVPMRDMDGDEWYALEPELRERAMRAGLYEGVHDKKAEEPPRPTRAAEPEPRKPARAPRKVADDRPARVPRKTSGVTEVATVATEEGPEIVPAEVAADYEPVVSGTEGG